MTADHSQSPKISVALHGPNVTIAEAVKAGAATVNLLRAVGDEMGESVEWEVAAVYFCCDGCGLRLPDRPGPGEGWTHRGDDDLCPACSSSSRGVV